MNLSDRLAEERRGRLAAERLLELKSKELFEANRKLSQHALSLSDQIVEQRGQAERMAVETQQVKAELERAEQHVEIVERRLWDSVETITDGFAVFDAQDRLIAANTAWLAIFDFSPRIGPGTRYLEVLEAACDEDHLDLGGEPAGAWISRMLSRWDAQKVEPETVRTRGGQWFRMLDRRSRDGDMVCLAQNVTTLKEREAQLDEARHRAEAASRAKSSFLANMSHELRTPMNGVVSMAEMMLDGEEDGEKRLYLSTIKSSGEALLQIINQILDFSKMEAQRIELHPEPFDLERLLNEVLTLLSPSARDKGLAMHVDYDLFLPTRLIGDPARIRQILINIVGNAVKFTPEGHVLIRVVGIDLGAEGWQLHITVEDTGIGIPRNMCDHIFGSFAQVESEKNRSFEGTGLGLAITRQLVELMDGEIWVDSEEGRGSCFGFRLVLPDAEPERRAPPLVTTGLGRALVVGREGLDAETLSRQLAQLGLDVDRAVTGSEALALLGRSAPPQMVLIDDSLPDTTGPDLAQALSEAGGRSARLVICDTPHDAARLGGMAGQERWRPEAIDAVLVRPVLRSQLFGALVNLPHRQAPATGAETRAHPASPPESRAGSPASSPATDGGQTPAAGRAAGTRAVEPVARETGDIPGGRAGGAGDQAAEAPARAAAPVAAATGAATTPATGAPLRAMRVLAAEDNKTNRFVLAKMLRKLDIELHFAEDGAQAVEMFERLAPDLVFMDISMPRMDGRAAARRIREIERERGDRAAVTIVAMTAHALAGDREEILAAGIDHYLTKPLKRAQMEAHILQALPDACRPPQPEAAAAAAV
jgi:signal transduction histidine kinase